MCIRDSLPVVAAAASVPAVAATSVLVTELAARAADAPGVRARPDLRLAMPPGEPVPDRGE